MIDAYANGLDLYKDIMSFLLEKPYDQIDSKERANGKVIILGCGFGMGWEKFIEYAATFGVTLDEATAKKYVTAFREKYNEIPAFWKELDSAVVTAVKANICIYVRGLVVDGRNPQMLKIKLPCGRCLHYLDPIVTEETTDWGKKREGVSYHAWDAKGCQLKRLYGGLLCENVVQAVARDVLLNGMLEAEKVGFIIVMTIHDEVVGESPIDSALTYKDLEHAMTRTPEWAEGMGFILAAEGYDAKYYRK
jgi:DNA polymerase